MVSQKPLLLVTGFLGAGKTTLIRALLSDLSRGGGMRADVILNDIANAELDAASINPETVASIAPLTASCACCESLDELVALCKTASQGDSDLLLIELNGTADPLGLLEAFTLLRNDVAFSPMLQVCVIDVRHWCGRGELNPLERRQMEGASLHLLSHTDQATEDDVAERKATLGSEFPDSQEITTDRLSAGLIAKSSLPQATPLEGEEDHTSPSPTRSSDSVHALSHQVRGVEIALPPKVPRAGIERLLKQLPENVLRAKALVKLVEKPGTRWLFERSGQKVSPTPTPIPGIIQLSPSLLCMGFRLDSELIESLVRDQFGLVPRTKHIPDDHLRIRNDSDRS